MTSAAAKLVFIALLALLNGCASDNPSYAPVTTQSPDIITKNQTTDQNQANQNKTRYYLVKNGDTLLAISRLFNLDYRKLMKWNQIVPPYRLEIGRKLRVSDPNLENNKPHADEGGSVKNSEINQMATATQGTQTATKTASTANKINTQQKTTIILNNLTHQPPYKNLPVHTSVDKYENLSQKKSIISIDNKSMLKLNFRWPIKGKLLKAFSKTDNKGIDIAGVLGQDVNSAEAGKVVYCGQGLKGYGQLLIIKHNDVYLSAYANNSQLLVAEGASVEKGQLIAKMGLAESNITSLHFEIRKNGKPVNPLNFLPEKY